MFARLEKVDVLHHIINHNRSSLGFSHKCENLVPSINRNLFKFNFMFAPLSPCLSLSLLHQFEDENSGKFVRPMFFISQESQPDEREKQSAI